MILVDSSAWIDFLAGRDTAASQAIAQAMDLYDVVVGDLILAEVLQGVSSDREWRDALRVLRNFPQHSLCDPKLAELAAANYRRLRKSGLTVRGTIDVVIATWCLANNAAIIHNDRDMSVMEAHLGLVAFP